MKSKILLCIAILVFTVTISHSQSMAHNVSLKMDSLIFSNSLYFSFQSASTATREVQLVNPQGEAVLIINLQAIAGDNDVRINGLDKLPLGAYTLQVQIDTGQIVKQKLKKINTFNP